MASTSNDVDDRHPEEPASEADVESPDGEEVVSDLESARHRRDRVEELETELEARREEIEELQDLLLDLSTRVADDQGVGVCPDCHGPVVKVRGLFRPTTIECKRCDRVLHEY
ncbi:MAG: hypothetical protein V5A33_07855 [Halobacteriales archaeon]